ncbi:MAG: hypothetical protein GXO14_04810 [Thermococci archaeon]|nr:hypothetical protein [Thermococci archaeon]
MKILEIRMRLPYREKGSVLSRLLSKISGRIEDVHFLPPTVTGISEVRIEVAGGRELIKELKTLIKNGKVSFRVLSEA